MKLSPNIFQGTKAPGRTRNTIQKEGLYAPVVPSHKPELPQLQSAFFKLPFEIRSLIYKHLFHSFGYGDTIHIVTQSQVTSADPFPFLHPHTPTNVPFNEDKLAYVPCAAALGDPFQISGSHYGSWPRGHLACERIASWRTAWPSDGPPKPKDYSSTLRTFELALMLSCKRMYAETSDLLYTSLRFDALGLVAADRFLRSISPRHLSCIRKFHISWQTFTPILCPPMPAKVSELERREMLNNHRSELWARVCDYTARMRSLQELHMSIYDSDSRPTPEDELLDPLLQIRAVEKGSYIVALRPIDGDHIRTEDIFSGEAEAPFIIKRRLAGTKHSVEIDTAITHGHGHRRRRGPLSRALWVICVPFFCVYYAVDTLVECAVEKARR